MKLVIKNKLNKSKNLKFKYKMLKNYWKKSANNLADKKKE